MFSFRQPLIQQFFSSADSFQPAAGSFYAERFEFIGSAHGSSAQNAHPVAELLYMPPAGHNAEDFFSTLCANRETGIETDISIFMAAVTLRQTQFQGQPVSINLLPQTVFDTRFLDCLIAVKQAFPLLNCNRDNSVWLEITEKGGVPETFNPARLEMLKDLGFHIALDDCNPFEDAEWERLDRYAPHIDMIKLPWSVMREVRENDIIQAMRHIGTFRDNHPETLLTVEGFRPGEDRHYARHLFKKGVDFVQHSSFGLPKTLYPAPTFAAAPAPCYTEGQGVPRAFAIA